MFPRTRGRVKNADRTAHVTGDPTPGGPPPRRRARPGDPLAAPRARPDPGAGGRRVGAVPAVPVAARAGPQPTVDAVAVPDRRCAGDHAADATWSRRGRPAGRSG